MLSTTAEPQTVSYGIGELLSHFQGVLAIDAVKRMASFFSMIQEAGFMQHRQVS